MKTTNAHSREEIRNQSNNVDDTSKVGTWLSVGVVGVVILATYLVLFGLYMARV